MSYSLMDCAVQDNDADLLVSVAQSQTQLLTVKRLKKAVQGMAM